MSFYRFMDSRYLDDVLAGRFRFTSLAYYRLLEKIFEDEWIGDAHEGLAVITAADINLPAGRDPDGMREKLKALGIFNGDGSTVKIGSVQIALFVEGFVLCFAVGEIEELKLSMLNDAYNGCLVFSDVKSLAVHIYRSGILSDGRSVSDVFHPPAVDYVSYVCNGFNLADVESFAQGSPFVKREKYNGQNEYRIFFAPKHAEAVDVDVVTITVPSPEKYVAEEIRGESVGAHGQGAEDYKVALFRLYEIRGIFESEYRSNSCLYNSVKDDVRQWPLYKDMMISYWEARKKLISKKMDYMIFSDTERSAFSFSFYLDGYLSDVAALGLVVFE